MTITEIEHFKIANVLHFLTGIAHGKKGYKIKGRELQIIKLAGQLRNILDDEFLSNWNIPPERSPYYNNWFREQKIYEFKNQDKLKHFQATEWNSGKRLDFYFLSLPEAIFHNPNFHNWVEMKE